MNNQVTHIIGKYEYITSPEDRILPGDYFIAHFGTEEKEVRKCVIRDSHGNFIDWSGFYTCGGNKVVRLVYQKIVQTNNPNISL